MRPIMDVSRWQGNIDWVKVKTSGLVSGVMLRALGNSAEDNPSEPYIDPDFERNYAECQRLGMKRAPCRLDGEIKKIAGAEVADRLENPGIGQHDRPKAERGGRRPRERAGHDAERHGNAATATGAHGHRGDAERRRPRTRGGDEGGG